VNAFAELASENPWLQLKDRPWVLDSDRQQIETHNTRHARTNFAIETSVLPDPFVGNPNAPIWLLNLNPGLAETDLHHPPTVNEMIHKSLRLEADSFWYLEDEFSETSGHKWWRLMMGQTIRAYGVEAVKRSFFCIELFPYHSVSYKPLTSLLPSQKFTIDLVKLACQLDKRFIVMRQSANWTAFVPELIGAKISGLCNSQRPWISPGNIDDPSIFEAIDVNRVAV
jgi:hypothetical protein